MCSILGQATSLTHRQHRPLDRDPPKDGFLELAGMTVEIAEVARLIDAAGEQVGEQPLLGLLELGDESLRRPDRLLHRIQDFGDSPLLCGWWDSDRRLGYLLRCKTPSSMSCLIYHSENLA